MIKKFGWVTKIPGFQNIDPTGRIQSVNFFGSDASKKFGPVYLMWENFYKPIVVIADIDGAKEFYKDHLNHPRTPNFTCLGQVCQEMIGDAIGTTYGKDWAVHRKALNSMIKSSYISKFLPMIHQECHNWVILNLNKDKNLKINNTINRLTLHIVAKVVYGHLTDDEEKELYKIADLHEELMNVISVKKLDRKSYESNILMLYRERWDIFNIEMMKKDLPQDSLLSIMLSTNNLTQKQIVHNLDEILLFNLDVMYSALGALFVNLDKHQDCQDKIYQEISENFPFVFDKDFDMNKLKYMNMFILESARMNPSLSLSFPESTAKPMLLAGHYVPKGTTVLIDAFSINLSDKFNQPDVFNPERFNDKSVNQRMFHRFGLGPRTCLGQKIAQAIIQSILIQSIYKCHFGKSKLDDQTPEEIGIKDEGLAFFTPYIKFPDISYQTRLNISSKYFNSGFTFKTGSEILSRKGPVLCGISLRNSYYSKSNIESLMKFMDSKSEAIYPFIPATPSIYTYLGAGIDPKKADRKLRLDFNALRNRVKGANANNLKSFDWKTMVEDHPIFQESLERFKQLYIEDKYFFEDVNKLTLGAIGKDGNLDLGKNFLLNELAFLAKATEILQLDEICYVYHTEWDILNNLVEGKYNYPKIDNLGFVIVRK